MKKYLARLGAFWMYGFILTTILFVVSLIVYGFDISFDGDSGRRKTLLSELENSPTINFFYEIDETFAFGVFTDREPGGYDVIVTSYTVNYPPFCYFCGYHMGDPDNDQGFSQPYRQGNILYDIEPLDEAYMGLPEGAYATLNTETGEFGHVMDLNEIGSEAIHDKYRVTREYVVKNYDEISYSSADDEDCMIAFGAVTLCYSILIIWGIPMILFRRNKT